MDTGSGGMDFPSAGELKIKCFEIAIPALEFGQSFLHAFLEVEPHALRFCRLPKSSTS